MVRSYHLVFNADILPIGKNQIMNSDQVPFDRSLNNIGHIYQ